MSDLYQEHLVKKERTTKDMVVKAAVIGVTVILAAAGLFIQPIILIAAIVFGCLGYFFWLPGTDLEYEYLYVNGELDIDKIMSKTKRKKVKSLDIKNADLVAPTNSHRMDYYNNSQKLKTLDFSSGNPQHKRFSIVIRDGGETCIVIIEPDEKMISAMRMSAPSKVFLD